MSRALDRFTDPTRNWFEAALGTPTPVQERGWIEVGSGAHTLMCAPTGSGKTLAAFLWCLDRLAQEPTPPARERCRVLYVSPLKALTVDVERNLRAPLRGIAVAAEARGAPVPEVNAAIRSGDTPAAQRREMERHPPDILITTPESLFLLLTSAARELLVPVRWVIIDEIHTMAGSKRGAHLALSLERLAARANRDPQRIGLSATQRPLEEVARYLGGGGRDVHIVDAGTRKPLDLLVEVPVEDMGDLDRRSHDDRTSVSAPGADPRTPRRSIWPALHPRLIELIREHRSTIIFVNSRRLAERLAAQLNEVAGEELVRAHHGSIAREQRRLVEDLLKAGEVPALVATSSLELGIDMGAVDLVIQVESPTTVSRGLQRIGRAGHSVGEPSRGRILPKWRGDLLECAAIVPAMLAGEVEPTRIPRNPLDVLAQQIVAMCALDEWRVDDLAALVRRAAPFAALGTRALEAVLDMLDGRYPSEEFAELRARISWDRLEGTLRGRAGAQRLAVTSGGTIPDRGLYSVNLLEDGRRVGELDEEMVYETRPGEVFVLGASSWRVAEITAQQVLVTPAPGEPGKIAFWHGDTLGRPVEVGRSIGALMRELQPLDEPAALERLRVQSCFEERAAANLLSYLREEREHTGTVPDDRTVVVQRFRDQLGDWRLCVLTPLGARVHTPWAIAVQARLRSLLGVEVQEIHSDDGFALRIPDVEALPPVEELLLDPDEVEQLVTTELHGSALFAARFRENAARALLLPRRRPGERTPLWKQRQRSADLLQVAGRHPDFPILVETYRECLADVFDMEALTRLMRDIRSRAVRVVEVDTERASPFAASLMFDYIAQFIYEGDQPLAERRAQALTLDRQLLAELLGSDELRELLDPAVVTQTELELQALDARHPPRDLDEALDLLRHLGDLSTEEAQARGIDAAWLAELDRRRRALRVRVAGAVRWIATDDAARYRDALGVALPPGLPDALLEGGSEAMAMLFRRYARTHVPFTAAEVAQRFGLSPAAAEVELSRLVRAEELLAGRFHPGRTGEREFCHPEVLRQLRRRSLAALRREIEPVPPNTLVQFLPAWHGVGGGARGGDRLLEIVTQLQGAALPVSVLERDLLPARMDGYQPRMLDELVSTGEVVWVGRGALGSADGRVALYRSDAVRGHAPAPVDPPGGRLADHIRARLAHRGACFFRDLLVAAPGGADDLLAALWELVWAGEVTNDAFAPLRLARGARARTSQPRRPGPPRAQGRWSLVVQLLEPHASATESLHALAGALLLRHGVLTRESVVAENLVGGFSAVYPVLRAMEESGRVRRGYFVDGLGGSQFALPGAVDRLRGGRAEAAGPVLLSAVDPANPFGVTVPWPECSGGRAARQAGAYVLLEGTDLVAYLERGGRSLLALRERLDSPHVAALGAVASRLGRLEVRTVNGRPVATTAHAEPLLAGGFAPSVRGLVAYGDRRSAVRTA